MYNLIVNDFRCFGGLHRIPIHPLTILVGENSSGKSSMLAALRLAWDTCFGHGSPNFNEEPFDLGSYREIANWPGGAAGRAAKFELGLEFEPSSRAADSPLPSASPIWLKGKYVIKGGQPTFAEWSCGVDRYSLTWDFGNKSVVAQPGTMTWKPREFPQVGPQFLLDYWQLIVHGPFHTEPSEPPRTPEQAQTLKVLEALTSAVRVHTPVPQRPTAIAPVRTSPQRVYKPARDIPKPGGDHVPYVLASTQVGDPAALQELLKNLSAYGAACGLFQGLKVKKFDAEGQVFQLLVKLTGPHRNIVDVGYGVSQALPILVEALRNPSATFLIQQPEVHLHPRAQAELGSFFGRLASQGKGRFVLETHSDYLVDRVRIDVRDRKSPLPALVSILFFERRGHEVKVHPIELDERGNLRNRPRGYRTFFLQEERRLLQGV